jgi:bifunctional enzyme CysN/CysC
VSSPAETTYVTRQPTPIGRAERWAALGLSGATVLLTGLPAAGKSTIGAALERRLIETGRAAYLLDGDVIRRGLSSDLGYSQDDRAKHLRRAGQVAVLLADAGVVAVLALISPQADERETLRRLHAQAELPFVEVFVDTPVCECERRDPKGLYARAHSGELPEFTGVGAPYEAPENPEVRIPTLEMTVDEAVSAILALLSPQLP